MKQWDMNAPESLNRSRCNWSEAESLNESRHDRSKAEWLNRNLVDDQAERYVSEIRKLTGGRFLVVLDDGSCFPLYKKELDIYEMHEEETVNEAYVSEIMTEVLPKRAKMRAMHLLQQQDRTEHQLRSKLESLDYPKEIVTEAIEYVKRYHYVDDLRYAVCYMEYRKESRSMRQMEQELQQKGIAREIIREAMEQIETPDEETQIRELLQKKGYHPDRTDRKERERLFRFLLRKGYGMSAVQHALRWEE